MDPKPLVGIAVLCMDQQRIIIGKRTKQPQQATWQLPGDALRYREQPEQAVLRNLSAFDGLHFSPAKFVTYTSNDFCLVDQSMLEHSISLYFAVRCLNPQALADCGNSQCSEWRWQNYAELPQSLFLPLHLLTEKMQQL